MRRLRSSKDGIAPNQTWSHQLGRSCLLVFLFVCFIMLLYYRHNFEVVIFCGFCVVFSFYFGCCTLIIITAIFLQHFLNWRVVWYCFCYYLGLTIQGSALLRWEHCGCIYFQIPCHIGRHTQTLGEFCLRSAFLMEYALHTSYLAHKLSTTVAHCLLQWRPVSTPLLIIESKNNYSLNSNLWSENTPL